MNRREFLGSVGIGILCPALPCDIHDSSAQSAGEHSLASFDKVMEGFMQARQVPGGALAVVKDRRLVYARGYGWADRERKLPVTPTSLFRIASISKPFTSVAVLKLVEQGKVKLDDRAFERVNLPPILGNGAKVDPRPKQITVGQLLHHTGGWDRDKSFDPMFRSKIISAAAGVAGPADAKTIIRYMLGQPLDFDPGTSYAYSNFGYCVLGRLIEKVTGKPYEAFVKESVLAPIGIRRMRVGASRQSGAEEVRYYTQDGALAENVFPGAEPSVPWPYGGFHLEAMDAHGGWIASAVDLARFAAGLEDPARSRLLKPETFKLLYAPPAPPVARRDEGKLEATFYACGWQVRPVGSQGRPNYWHNGSLPGTFTILVRRGDGLSWAALFNQRSIKGRKGDAELDPALHRAAAEVKQWPEVDLFPKFA